MTPAARELRPAALALALLAGCVLSFRALAEIGRAGRVHGEPRPAVAAGVAARTVRTSADVYAVLRRDGGRGRVIVSASRYLQFEDDPGERFWRGQQSFPLRVGDLVPSFEREVGPRNRLWVAMRAGIAREIVHVVPPAVFPEKLAAAQEITNDVVSVGAHEVTLHHWGSRRAITDAVPSVAEPVVLVVDASYFDLAAPEDLVRQLAAAATAADLVILDLAEDNPQVSARGRDALLAFAARIGAGGDRAR